jgi:glucose/arabinose dehydrogenase
MTLLLRRCVLPILCVVEIQTAAAQLFAVDTLAKYPAISSPGAIAFSPENNGVFFFTEKSSGRVRVYRENTVLPTPFTTVRVASTGEQGLIGLALHPQYPDSPFVYILYTRSSDRANIIVRYRDSLGVGIQPRAVFIVPRTNNATVQNGGNIHFGPDGKLYVSVGDFGVPSNAQDTIDTKNARGKILRLNPDGSIPADNPFTGKPYWSYGHHNSFDFAFDAETGILVCTENQADGNNGVYRVERRSSISASDTRESNGSGDDPFFVRPLSNVSNGFPSLTGVAVYRSRTFPRLFGKVLVSGNSNPTLWSLTVSAEEDSVLMGTLAQLFTYSAGFADVKIGPDGYIYLTCGQNAASRILRLRPIAPSFSSTPLQQATQDVPYSYSPACNGTPSEISIVSGPSGMFIDSASWTVKWTPGNTDALERDHQMILRAQNGAGYVDQEYVIHVTNVNDPPSSFSLRSPANDTTLSFVGIGPEIMFSWADATDPDRDSLRYTLQIDTISTFSSAALRQFAVGTANAVSRSLPRSSGEYYWRVLVTDGTVSTASATYRELNVAFVKPGADVSDKTSEASVLEQNFPNPFNPSTYIKYTIPKSGHVKLVVFNLLGQEVAVIFEGTQAAGMYEFEFKSGELPSGIYFYRIQAPDFIETKKMIVTK